jgi:hypothetical protein
LSQFSTVRVSVARAQVVVTRRIFGEFVMNEPVSIFLMKFVGLIYCVFVGTLKLFPVLRLDALA